MKNLKYITLLPLCFTPLAWFTSAWADINEPVFWGLRVDFWTDPGFQFHPSDPDAEFTYRWYFGDGSTSREHSPSHTYAAYGTYNVVLKVSDGKTTERFERQVTVSNPPPEVDDIEVNARGLNVDFSSFARDLDGEKLTYKWYFGDGTTSKEEHPTHAYNTYGTYKVTLKVSDGTTTVKKEKQITVGNEPPEVDFDVDIRGRKVYFHNRSSDPGDDKLTYKWYFGDGATSKERDPSHTYSAYGTYDVTLKVSDGTTTVKKTQTVTLSNQSPVVSFHVMDTRGLRVYLSNDTIDPDDDKLTYKWDFGDGTTSKEKEPEHTYATEGTYKVILKVSDGTKTVKKAQTVTVSNNPPVASFEIGYNSGRAVYLENYSYDPDWDDELRCKWDFGDGTTSRDCYGAYHEYEADGTYKVVLKVSDGSKTAKTAKNVTVTKGNEPPVAYFEVSDKSEFKVSLQNLSSDPDGDKLTYKWYFGDGATSKEQNPVHTYAQPGVYQITLKASDGNKTVKYVQNVSVMTNQSPVADFEVWDRVEKRITLVNTSYDPDGDDLKYKWYFGDGSTSKERNPVHTYAESGTYSVVLKVSDGQVTKSKTMKISVGGEDGATELWVSETGESNYELVKELPEVHDSCRVDPGTIIVSDTFYGLTEYYAYLWNEDTGASTGAWPGEEFTNAVVDGCERTTRQYIPFGTSWDNLHMIISDGNGWHTMELVGFSQARPCVILRENDGQLDGEIATAAECGVHIDGMDDEELPNEVYVYLKDQKLSDGDEIEITEKAGNPDTRSVEIVALIRGKNAGTGTRGYYWIDDDEFNKRLFINGDVLSIGENVLVGSGETRNAVLHLQYEETDDEGIITGITEASFIITKSYSEVDDVARMTRPSEMPGVSYSAEKTTFRLWSPDSADVRVSVDGTDYEMKPAQLEGYTKVYEAAVEGDLAGKTYQFYVNGIKVRDPYGRMTAWRSDTANIVMNMENTDPEEGWTDRPAFRNREDAVVYEVHVRDFTIDPTSGVDEDKRGRYLGMVQKGTEFNGFATGIDHLKKLGVTHVQLMPIFDYAACSGVDSQDNSCYNWGYDPWNFNVPEDRYTSVFGTDQYEQKIKEVKTMIDEFHKNGIRVVMEVVYNHTFDRTVFEKITEKYYMGNTDLTGCGNTISADNNMVWMMIRDSLDYWVTEYHVDGFKFDLAGVLSMKDYSDLGEYLNRHHPDANLLIYGDAWSAGDSTEIKDPVRPGRMFMQASDAHVGAFNMFYRNCLKSTGYRSDSEGNTSRLGFIFNQLNTDWDSNGTDEKGNALSGNRECVFMGVKAGIRTENAPAEVKDEWSAQGFSDPEQAISYITAHDNLALRDKIERASIDGNVLYNEDEVRTIQAYANSIIMVSQGIAFIHGGEEMGRTKKAAGESGESPMWNTYKTTSGANDFKWNLLKDGWAEVNDTYGAYIKMRREHPAFRMTTAELINENVTLDEASTDEVVIININGEAVNDEWGTIKVVMNSKDTEVEVAGVDGMTKAADGVSVSPNIEQNNKAAPRAVSIWVTKNENYCKVTQRFDNLYIVGSFAGSSWTTFIEMERQCQGEISWWETKEPVGLPAGAEFLFFEKSGDWNSTMVGYDSSNVTEQFCINSDAGSTIAHVCALWHLTEGPSAAGIRPDEWTSGVTLGGRYMLQVMESDLTMKMWQEAQ